MTEDTAGPVAWLEERFDVLWGDLQAAFSDEETGRAESAIAAHRRRIHGGSRTFEEMSL